MERAAAGEFLLQRQVVVQDVLLRQIGDRVSAFVGKRPACDSVDQHFPGCEFRKSREPLDQAAFAASAGAEDADEFAGGARFGDAEALVRRLLEVEGEATEVWRRTRQVVAS